MGRCKLATYSSEENRGIHTVGGDGHIRMINGCVKKRLTHLLGQEIHVLFVPAHWSIE